MIKRSLLHLIGGVFLILAFTVSISQACDSANQTSTDLLAPVDYWGFRPPPKGQSYDDPVFCTTITTITDHHGQWTWNGELARFNSDDSLLLQCYHDVNGNQAIWLFDGTTGEKVKEIPLTDADRFRWSHDPDIFYYVDGNAIHTYNVQTQQDQVLYRFTEYTSVGLAGGDGNDLSDDYRWCVLDGEDKELFTFDLINKQKGTVWPIPTGGRPGGKSSGDIDYATISPSGQYVIVHWINDSSTERYHGTELYDRDWNFRRQIVAYDQHCELGYDPSGEEIYITTPVSYTHLTLPTN